MNLSLIGSFVNYCCLIGSGCGCLMNLSPIGLNIC